MNLDYADIFEQRGAQYHAAMGSQPLARTAEFKQVFSGRALVPGDTILDVPAGGGYLARSVGTGMAVTALEFTAGFSEHVPVVAQGSDWPVGRFDRVVCLAALHHIPDRPEFATRLHRHVRPGGTLHVADVDAESSICTFLDGFVGRYNGTGHSGVYLDRDVQWLAKGQPISRNIVAPCPWAFSDHAAMLQFCTGLFGLQGCTPEALLAALDRDVGFDEDADGVRLNWQLRYVDIEVG